MDVSIVIPVHNEQENVAILHKQLCDVIDNEWRKFEIIFVDDGSFDQTSHCLRAIAASDSRVRIVRFGRNFGQTAAMQAGIEHSVGKYVVTIDGDLQNDPRDIPMMLEHLDKGYDLIHGWRKERQDAWLNRRLPSQIANWLISRVTGMRIHDLGCTLKAMRRSLATELDLCGEMHRFIPVLAAQRGASCLEVVTHHRARQHGTTKYGIARTLQVVLDLMTVRYMQKYFANPMKLFGGIGAICCFASCLSLAATIGMKLMYGTDMTGNPLLLFAGFAGLVSFQLFSLGLLGEVAARIYFDQSRHRPFNVTELIGFEQTDESVGQTTETTAQTTSRQAA